MSKDFVNIVDNLALKTFDGMHSCAMVGLCKVTLSGIVLILFVKEKYFWKLLCLGCTGFLLMKLVIGYFCLKPTVSTVEEINLSQIHFNSLVAETKTL